VVTPIAQLRYRDADVSPAIKGFGKIARALYDELTGIQFGRLPDRRGWTRKIDMSVPAPAGA